MLTPVNVAGVTDKVVLKLVPLKEAVIVAVVTLDTPEVVTVKLAVVVPAGTVTEMGVVAPTVEDRFTIVPPAGAGRLSVTAPVTVFPPITDVGDTLTPASNGV